MDSQISSYKQSSRVFLSDRGHDDDRTPPDDRFPQSSQPQGSHECWHDAGDGWKHLQAHVVTAAFDSGHRVRSRMCDPDTRQDVLDVIMNWIIPAVPRVKRVLWLKGAAGGGKTTIGRSTVGRCHQQGIPIACFFFLRGDRTLNNVENLVATLVYQLLQDIPDLEQIIPPTIQRDPLIFTKSLKTQFDNLIFQPLCQLSGLISLECVPVLFFDGVDECKNHDDQTSLIRIVTDLMIKNSFPAIAFFASRTESHISAVFKEPAILKITLQLPLDARYLPENDIRRFLDSSFTKIRNTHQFGNRLASDWPAAADVQRIVDQSSGQFIYPSQMVDHISMPNRHPAKQLDVVCGRQGYDGSFPFAQLDNFYLNIFSGVEDFEKTSLVLAWLILSKSCNLDACAEFLGLKVDDIYLSLTSLRSVMDFDEHGNIHFLHASIPDFLLDKNRSQNFHIHRTAWSTKLSIRALKFLKSNGSRDYFDISDYITEAEGTLALRDCVHSFHPIDVNWAKRSPSGETWAAYLSAIQQWELQDDGLYQSQREAVVRYISAECPDQLATLEKCHAISAILAQMKIESEAIELNMTAEHELEESKKYRSRRNSGSDIRGEGESASKIQWAEEARIRREERQASERQLAAKEAEWAKREEKIRSEERNLIERQLREIEAQWKEREAEIRREEREACKEERLQEDRRRTEREGGRGGGIKLLLRRIFRSKK